MNNKVGENKKTGGLLLSQSQLTEESYVQE